MNDFWELYKHPEWQRKRLEIMNRADFTCELCGNKDNTLNVHHSYYEKGNAPWEYPSESLHCLCKRCHEVIHDWLTCIKQELGKLPLIQLPRIIGYLRGMQMFNETISEVQVSSYQALTGLADAWGLEPNDITHAQGPCVIKEPVVVSAACRKYALIEAATAGAAGAESFSWVG